MQITNNRNGAMIAGMALLLSSASFFPAAAQGAAEYYTEPQIHGMRPKAHGFFNALACLFLLSTGDDQYIPRVKEYFSQFLAGDGRVQGIGEMTWDNGYNGIACAEYYLRTGDKSVLPILQHYCDDARNRQYWNKGWTHWGQGVNPGYEVGGGLLNAAGNQVLVTLLLGKACGVEVDDRTLRSRILDLPPILEVTRTLVASSGVADRIEMVPCDVTADGIGEGFDVALVSGLLHRMMPATCRSILQKVHAGMEPGGQVIVNDLFTDHGEPEMAVLFGLQMLLTNETGGAHDVSEVASWLSVTGFVDVAITSLFPHTAMIARKPTLA